MNKGGSNKTMLIKYNNYPFTDMEDFTKGLSIFDTFNRMLSEEPSSRPWAPPVDILETENELVIKADLPDLKLEDIEVRMENSTLTLKGKREFEKKDEGKGYHRIERSYGSFVRAFSLPDSSDPEKVAADYKNGVLTVTVGKKEIAKPRTVKVNVSAN
jgi:HSP20 family protein